MHSYSNTIHHNHIVPYMGLRGLKHALEVVWD
ncbi:hypothetical protein F383_10364 [Gossypium arboreum]|uniref:Uncharacterized protein n=1 Tax=Gossypium arboreum TaxID=29729 RepID=A0A0B0NQI4_GOSAR|nr:hypothetical protein F383_10364 [Gossypium arboreum]